MRIVEIGESAAAVSHTVYEAAKVSGAKGHQTFFRITLPLLTPGIATGWILAFFAGFRELVILRWCAGTTSTCSRPGS
ncbi:ABC transporter permease subunit [Corynebacterium simulans]|uniref:ABC transporter permease subunit n=1 Tax=Corynebacterium simulans TaxID=146827 RepID=UPI00254FD925|nr:ABC transporter permease subunit [Corynebacterium simulans]MDK7137915.1 ABC transporter permease subunit [Corynebacterium simulans]